MRSVKMMREMNMRREKTYVRRMSISQRFFMQEKIMRSGGSLMREQRSAPKQNTQLFDYMTADDIFRSVSKELAHAELIWLNDMGMLGNAELAITRKGKGSVVNQCRLAERRNLCVAMGFCISGHRCSLFDRAEGMAHRA